MFASVQNEVNDRLNAVETILKSVKDGIVSDAEDALVNNVRKGVFFVVLYGALEYTITATVSAVIRTINERSVNINSLRPRLLSIALHPQFDALKDARSKMWVKRLDLLQKIELNDFFGAEDTLLPVQNGNIKFKSLEFIWELFGLSSGILPEKRMYGLFDTLAENRMSIAHGRKAPQEVGRSYSKSDLDVFYTSFKNYLSYLISSFEAYVQNQEYLL